MEENTLRLDSVGGISGDMLLGALIGLGADVDRIQKALNPLIPARFEIKIAPADAQGVHGLRATVLIEGQPGDAHHAEAADETTQHPHTHAERPHAHTHADEHTHGHDHSHRHSHGHKHTHGHAHTREHDQAHDPEHRGLTQISELITDSPLPEAVKEAAIHTFHLIGLAEAKIHGTTPDEVHFHEVGATDALVDIIGCHLAIHQLDITHAQVGPLPLGTGTMRCQHGTMPLPSPATMKILEGHPVLQTQEPFELVTPTGAALLMTLKAMGGPSRETSVATSAIALGMRTLKNRPNLVRATLLTGETTEETTTGACELLQANMDDSTPEWIGALLPALLEAGALDAWIAPIQMKKNRPGSLLSVLCEPATRPVLEKLIFTETTTFGIRRSTVSRTVLERRLKTVSTEYGEIIVKVGIYGGKDTTLSPEHDSCAEAAQASGVSIREVWSAAIAATRKGV